MVVAYLYTSVSPADLAAQRQWVRRYAETRSIQIDKWVVEVYHAAAHRRARARLSLILSRLRRGDELVVADIARLSAKIRRLMTIIELCLDRGAALACIRNRYLFDTSIGMGTFRRAFSIYRKLDCTMLSSRSIDSFRRVRRRAPSTIGRPRGSHSTLTYLYTHLDEISDMLRRNETILNICLYFKISEKTFYNFRNRYGLWKEDK